jgi:transcriptional regulator of acetoin/glycerol metabolism
LRPGKLHKKTPHPERIDPMPASTVPSLPERSLAIAQARRELIHGEASRSRGSVRIEPWIVRSWQRCIEAGREPQQRVNFEPVAQSAICEVAERNRALLVAARPVIERVSRAIADTRYFAVLTDADGIVVDVPATSRAWGSTFRSARSAPAPSAPH